MDTNRSLGKIVFGPVPSRRLGRTLGVNNVPPKSCTYSCVYCQLGRTPAVQFFRESFYDPQVIFETVGNKVATLGGMDESIDYITFVADGEPTLDTNLGVEIGMLKSLGFKVAVITNGTLLWREDVREDLEKADWVSMKIDAVREQIWQKLNRPYWVLNHKEILEGMTTFSQSYSGKLTTETMLVTDVNDGEDHMVEIAEFIAGIRPSKAYLALPIRVPAERWVGIPSAEVLNACYQIFADKLTSVELLSSHESNGSIGSKPSDL